MKIISKDSKTVKSAFNDEFESYLKKQQVKTTFNGTEVESFSWYRKALGLAQVRLNNNQSLYEVFILGKVGVNIRSF